MTIEGLAVEADTSAEYLARLVEIRALAPDAAGWFSCGGRSSHTDELPRLGVGARR